MAEPLTQLAGTLARLDPELYTSLQDEGGLEAYLSGFADSAALAGSLERSRYDFLEQILEEDFGETWLRYHQAGNLHYELLNLCEACAPTFRELDWPLDEDSRLLRYLIIAEVGEHLNE
jgi:hypothetical protein